MSPVLDLRRGSARRLADLWAAWEAAPPGWTTAAAAWTEPLRRRRLESLVRGRGPAPADRLVVSVGNLRLGGTGKTPVVRGLAARLTAAGVGGAVICRGYGSGRRGPCRVTPDDAACGDEARLLAAALPWPVIQAADRAAGLALARTLTAPGDVLLLEDGHQTARAPRHLDLLILDRWTEHGGALLPATGRPLPWGPYREGVEGAARAQVLLVEAADARTPPPCTADGRPVLVFRRRSRLDADPPAGPVGTLAGLARPEGFEDACAALLGRAPVLNARLDDHAVYGPDVRARLRRAAAAHGLRAWLTTGKDEVKLGGEAALGAPLLRVDLELDWDGDDPAALLLRDPRLRKDDAR